ncbi:MAG: hypothetical protein U0835_14095 [Isosphaeraceae bacterium]
MTSTPRAEGRQLAVAVAGHGVGPQAEVLQHAEEAHDRADGGLAVSVARPLVVRVALGLERTPGTADAAAQPGTALRRGRVGQGERLLHLRKDAGEVAEHADVLRPWPGKSISELARGRARAEEDAVPLPGRGSPAPVFEVNAARAEASAAAGSEERSTTSVSRCAAEGRNDWREAAAWSAEGIPGGLGLGPGVEGRDQPFTRVGRVRDDLHRAVPVDSGLGRAGLFEHAVIAAAAEAEALAPRASGARPGGARGRASVFT